MKGIRNRSYEANLDKRVKNARRICIGICILAALFIFRWQIAKAVFGVDSFSIDTSEISSDEYENAAAVLEKRVRTLSGGAYTRIDHGDRITFEVPSGLFLGKDPYTVIGQEICAEKIMMMGLKEKGGDDLCSLLSLSGEEDVDRVIPLPGAVVLTLTGKSQNDLKEYTSDGEKLDCVVFDVDSDHEKRYPAMSFCGKYIVVPLIAEDPGLPASLQKMQFTEAPVYADLDYCCDDLSGRIDWENPYKNDFAGGGYNQTEFEYLFIDGNVNCISYVEDLYLREMGMEDEEGDTVETREVIRNRLDSLGVDYAIGEDRYDRARFWIALPEDSITYEQAGLLGEPVTVWLGTRYGNDFVDYSVEMDPVSVSADGLLSASVADVTTLNFLKDDLSARAENSNDDLYLYVNDTAVAGTDTEKAIAGIESRGTVDFDRNCFGEMIRNSEDPESAMRFIEALSMNPMEADASLESCYTINENGEVVYDDEGMSTGLNCCRIDEDTVEELNGKYEDLTIRYNPTAMALNLIYTYGSDQNGYDDRALRSLRKFIDENKDLIEGEKVHKLTARVKPSKRTACRDEGAYTYEGEEYFVGDDGLYMVLGKNFTEHPEEFINVMSFGEITVDYYSRDSFFRTAIEKEEEYAAEKYGEDGDWPELFSDIPYAVNGMYEPGKEYVLLYDMNVRESPSKESRVLNASELSDEDRDKAVEGDNAVLRKGSTVTCLETDGSWIRTGSGWICGSEGDDVYIMETEPLTDSEYQICS